MMRAPDRTFFMLGSGLAFLGVAAGAFGAHGLADRLDAHHLAVWETGARYHLYQALALLAVSWASTRWPGRAVAIAGWCFVVGIALFSGSLYLLALTGVKTFGAITPLGGASFLVGWAALVVAAWRQGP